MTSPPPTILVTGASGFVGGVVVRVLRERVPHAVILSPPGRLEDVGREPLPDHLDGVLHLAARTPKDAQPEDDADVRAVIGSNVVGLESLLAAIAGRCRRMVFTSTIDVYRPPADGALLDESSPLGPATVYGASKVLGESMVRAWAARHGARHAILRVGHVYGPGEDRYRKLIPTAIRSALAGEPIVVAGDPSALRDYLYVDDAAQAIVDAWEALRGRDVGTVNVARGASTSVGAVAEAVAGLAGGRIEYAAPGSGLPGRSFRFDTRRMRDVLGERAATPFLDGLRAEVEWFRRSARD